MPETVEQASCLFLLLEEKAKKLTIAEHNSYNRKTIHADFFITGDRDFTEAQKLIKTTIISVSSFKEFLERQDPEELNS